MKSTHSLIAVSIAIALALTDARKHLDDASKDFHEVAVPDPKVKECSSSGVLCFFNDGTKSWCITPQTPLITTGWEFT